METVDIIVHGTAIFTGLSDEPQPAWIAIRGNRIQSIGNKKK